MPGRSRKPASLEAPLDPFYIRVHPDDNVAVIVNPAGLPAGTTFADGLSLRAHVPEAHKFALRHFSPGDPVIRYGAPIATALRDIRQGEWVRPELLALPDAPSLDVLPLATAPPPPQPALEGFTFEGYRNADGSAGTRNILGITTTVQCVAPTVDHAAQRIREEVLPRYSNVDGVVAVTHTY